jgi:hypothetical protein
LAWIEVLEEIFRLGWVPAQTLEDCLEVLRVHETCFLRVEHVEDAFEIVNFLSCVHLENLIFLVVVLRLVEIIVVWLDVAASQLFLYFFLGPFFVVLVNSVILLFFMSLCVIVTFLVLLLIHFKLIH